MKGGAMGTAPAVWLPWLAVAGLGAFHGLNPAMGWLFAVGLGLHRHSRATVLLSLVPIALGHAAAVATALMAVVAFGVFMDQTVLARFAGAGLIGWAAWHAVYGHRRRVRIGMQTSLAGLALWSLLVANGHGAGLMLIPAFLPLCLAQGPAGELTAGGSLSTALAVLAVHTGAMLTVIAAISILVYEWTGLAFLRRGWINLDLVWIGALAVSGVLLLAA
jgi:hypothetical protein